MPFVRFRQTKDVNPVSARRAVRPGLTADAIEDEVVGVILAAGSRVARLPNF